MNERIDDLMYRAGLTAQGCWHNMDDYDREAIQKFAELIVGECAEFARQHNLEKADRSHLIHRAIKEHFGVEE